MDSFKKEEDITQEIENKTNNITYSNFEYSGTIISTNSQIIDVKFSEINTPKIGAILYHEDSNGNLSIFEVNQYILSSSKAKGKFARAFAIKLDSKIQINDKVFHKNKTLEVPLEPNVLSRAFNVFMEPIDGKPSPLFRRRTSIFNQNSDASYSSEFKKAKLLNTGVKAIDLLCPIFEGQNASIFGSAGVGKSVLLQEIIYIFSKSNILKGNNENDNILSSNKLIFMGIGERTREGLEFMKEVNNLKISDSLLILFAQMNETPGARFRLPYVGMRIAEYFRDDLKSNVFIFIDNVYRYVQAANELAPILGNKLSLRGYQTSLHADIASIQERIKSSSSNWMASIQCVFVPAEDETDPAIVSIASHIKTKIFLSRNKAIEGIYPAIDPLKSTSIYLTKEIVGDEHFQVAKKVKEIIANYIELKKIVNLLGMEVLNPEQKIVFNRGKRVSNFLSQSFFVSEIFSGKKGTSIKIEDTIKSFKKILNGEVDHIPEFYFLYASTIEDVESQFNKSKK